MTTNKEIIQAIINLADHGDECLCSQCQKDVQVVKENKDKVDELGEVVHPIIHAVQSKNK